MAGGIYASGISVRHQKGGATEKKAAQKVPKQSKKRKKKKNNIENRGVRVREGKIKFNKKANIKNKKNGNISIKNQPTTKQETKNQR